MTSVCFDALPDHSRQCEYAFARTVRANYSGEQFARIIRVSVKRPYICAEIDVESKPTDTW